MIRSVVRLWVIRSAMAATTLGGLGIILFTEGFGISRRDLAGLLGFGEYGQTIVWTSMILFVCGIATLSILIDENDT